VPVGTDTLEDEPRGNLRGEHLRGAELSVDEPAGLSIRRLAQAEACSGHLGLFEPPNRAAFRAGKPAASRRVGRSRTRSHVKRDWHSMECAPTACPLGPEPEAALSASLRRGDSSSPPLKNRSFSANSRRSDLLAGGGPTGMRPKTTIPPPESGRRVVRSDGRERSPRGRSPRKRPKSFLGMDLLPILPPKG
jgi:hypothetical protein